MFREWDNFYLLVGGAAGALIGLMFVVATLTTEAQTKRPALGVQIFITPIVFHFGVVLIVSALAAVPGLALSSVGVLLAFLAALGFAYSTMTTAKLFGAQLESSPDWSDKCFYGILPMIAYLGLAAAAGAVWLAPKSAAYGVAAIMLVLLLIGIRNAWDLATFFVQRTQKPEK